jgi:hypothetical protein
MKVLRYLVAACFVLGLTGVANAFQFKVLDPATMEGSAPIVTQQGTPISFSFYQCPPSIDPSGTDTTLGCFALVNGTASPITSFSATITASSSLPSVSCPSGGDFGLSQAFTVESCLVTGDSLIVNFSGGDVATNSTLWIIEDGVDDSEFDPGAGTFTLNPTPEPSSFLLALSSMGPLGYLVRRRRKSSDR